MASSNNQQLLTLLLRNQNYTYKVYTAGFSFSFKLLETLSKYMHPRAIPHMCWEIILGQNHAKIPSWGFRIYLFFKIIHSVTLLKWLITDGWDVGKDGGLVGYKWVWSDCTGLALCTTDLSDYEWWSQGVPASSRLFKVLKKVEEEDQLFSGGLSQSLQERKKRVLSPRQVISSPNHRLGQIAPKCSW